MVMSLRSCLSIYPQVLLKELDVENEFMYIILFYFFRGGHLSLKQGMFSFIYCHTVRKNSYALYSVCKYLASTLCGFPNCMVQKVNWRLIVPFGQISHCNLLSFYLCWGGGGMWFNIKAELSIKLLCTCGLIVRLCENIKKWKKLEGFFFENKVQYHT